MIFLGPREVTKWSNWWWKYYRCFFCGFYYLLPIFSLNSFVDFILFGFPWATLFALYSYIFCSLLIWHSWYMTFTCYYFKLKFAYLYRQINECQSERVAFSLMKQLNSLQLEINKCNSQFWMFYITHYISQAIFVNSFLLYYILFNDSHFILRFLSSCCLFWYFVLFTVFLSGPSLVSREANISYPVFLQLFIRLNRKKKFSTLKKKMKVSDQTIFLS